MFIKQPSLGHLTGKWKVVVHSSKKLCYMQENVHWWNRQKARRSFLSICGTLTEMKTKKKTHLNQSLDFWFPNYSIQKMKVCGLSLPQYNTETAKKGGRIIFQFGTVNHHGIALTLERSTAESHMVTTVLSWCNIVLFRSPSNSSRNVAINTSKWFHRVTNRYRGEQ